MEGEGAGKSEGQGQDFRVQDLKSSHLRPRTGIRGNGSVAQNCVCARHSTTAQALCIAQQLKPSATPLLRANWPTTLMARPHTPRHCSGLKPTIYTMHRTE